MNSEQLQDTFGIGGQRFKLVIRILRQRILHQLDLFKLMLADNATRVLAVAACLRSKTWRVSYPLHRQLGDIENLFAIVVSHRNFGRRNQIEVSLVIQPEQVGFKFRQLPGSKQRVAIDDKRRESFQITMLTRVQLEHKIDQSPLEPRARALKNGKTRAGN